MLVVPASYGRQDATFDTLLKLLIPTSILLNLLLAPYTKVEESFNIQATHDILTYGVTWEKGALRLPEQYDHLTFTGPVPRTFVGPLALAGLSWPFIWLAGGRSEELGMQFIVRAILGLSNALCLLLFRKSVAKSFGRSAANWYTVFQASQFHIMFYASRTLPNFFAFGLTTLAMRNLLPLAGRSPTSRSSKARFSTALTLLTISGIIFRSEIALLLLCHTVYLLLAPHVLLPLSTIIPAGLLGALIGLALTVPTDTFFWRTYPPTPLWPELTAFRYNIIHAHASDWGTSPYHFYLTSALPRLLSNPLTWQVCIPFALLTPIIRRPALDVLVPNLAFITIYSLQPHKEWRFIIYTLPPFLAVASAGASWIWTRRAKNLTYRFLSLALIASSLATFAASGGMLFISRLNYPGGEALTRLHIFVAEDREATGVKTVHMDTLSCMTGVTRFLEKQPPPLSAEGVAAGEVSWVYDKTENETTLLDPFFWDRIDYALAEDPKRVPGRWEVLDTVEAFAGVAVLRPGEGGRSVVFQEVREVVVAEGRRWRDGGWKRVREELSREGGAEWVGEEMRRWADLAGGLARRYVTRGWWVRVKMEPRVRILRREKGALLREGVGLGGEEEEGVGDEDDGVAVGEGVGGDEDGERDEL